MNVINKITNLFKYEPKKIYNFRLTGDEEKESNITYEKENKDSNSTPKNVFSDLSKNLDCINSIFNTKINSDIVLREFTIYAKNKQYSAFLIYIDGLSDSKIINDFVIKPLMMRNTANTFVENDNSNKENNNNETQWTMTPTGNKNFPIVRVKKKEEKFDLSNYIFNCLLPQNNIEKTNELPKLISGINSGNCALFIDTLKYGFDIDVKSFQQRGVDKPNNEIIIKGPQEAFVENLRTNTSLIRRIVNNENLVIENLEVGKLSKTKCAVCYMKDIANNNLVEEIKYRISNLEIDSLLSSGELEQLIEETNHFGIPKTVSTERPDKTTKSLFEGKVIILVNGTPYAIITPATFSDFISSPEDTNLNPAFANFLKVIRMLALLITLLLPSLWIAITTFHQELIPTELLFSIIATRETVPFPVIFEILIMEISFELIREASLRVPSAIGSTIGIVGALLLGDAAVNANIISPLLIIVVAITGIASFAIPDFSFGFHIRIMRFAFIFLGYIAGFLGISLGIFTYITILCSLKSFGVPYMVPFAPVVSSKGSSYFVPFAYKQEKRPDFLNTKRPIAQADLSMKWKTRREKEQ